jgi:hypothetical protein
LAVANETSPHKEIYETYGRLIRIDHLGEGTVLNKKKRNKKMEYYIMVGMIIGAAIGVALDSLGMGIGIGTAMGIALGTAACKKKDD